MPEPERHPLGLHEQTFAADAARLRRLFAAGIPIIAIGLDRYRIAAPTFEDLVWNVEE